jgi:hypothetical protein
MSVSMDKYKFVKTGNKVIAISSFAGKAVKGYAKCNPKDEFDLELGKKLAAARCNQKIAKKRVTRAAHKYDAAWDAVGEAEAHYANMQEYFDKSSDAYMAACNEVIKLEMEVSGVSAE